MTVYPKPWLEINGERYDTTPPEGKRRALNTFRITWGTEMFDRQPDASQLSAALWSPDPYDLWNTSFIGAHVKAGYTIGSDETTIFNGVVLDQSIRQRMETRGPTDTYGGLITEFTASDIRAQLSNIVSTQATLPRESYTKRVDRILSMFNDKYGQIESFTIPTNDSDYWESIETDAEGKTLTELLDEVYFNAGCLWAYWTNESKIAFVNQEIGKAPEKLIIKNVDGEIFIHAVSEYGNGIFDDPVIPGRYIYMDGSPGRSAAMEIAEVRATYRNETSTSEVGGVVVARSRSTRNPLVDSQITLEYTTANKNWQQQNVDQLRDAYDTIRDNWMFPPLVWDTKYSRGGFPTVLTVKNIISPYYTRERRYLTGSWFNRLNSSPVMVVMLNGEVEWLGDRWRVTFQPAPMVESMGYQTPIHWDELPTATAWNIPNNRVHESVTWEDLRLTSKGVD